MAVVLVKRFLVLKRCCGEDKAQLLMGFRHLITKQVFPFLQALSLLSKLLLIITAVL